MDLPCKFGKYELLDRIAVGGMAEVFLARSFGVEGFEKRVVIKRILPDLARSPRFVDLFIQEAKICGSLAHPNIVQVFELGRVGEDPYIAMEYIHGRDLAHVMRALRDRGELLPVHLAVGAVAKALRGLDYVHRRADVAGVSLKLVHQDISPQNILLTYQGQVKLVDFGIARLRDEADATQAHVGKRAYMAPEQRAAGPVDGRADIFGAGVVLYELLTGRRLFSSVTAAADAEIPDPRAYNPDVPDKLWRILNKMLAFNPEDRQPDAATAEGELRGFLDDQGARVDGSAVAAFMRDLFPTEPRPDPGLVSLTGLAWRDAANAPERSPIGPMASHGELRPAAVLVAELCGLTELSARQGTEEVVRRHFHVLRRFRRIVDRYGGVLGRFHDDTLVVFFGLPRASADDISRALSAGEAMHRVARALSRRGISVGVSVGVHHGEVAVSRPGGRELRVLGRGDSIKLATRLSAAAQPGQVLVSEAVAGYAEERFHFAPGPTIQRKGHGASGLTSRLLVGRRAAWLIVAGEAPSGRWMRRGAEIEQLSAALRSLAAGQGGLVLVRGDTGMGKTRLLREVRELARAQNLPFHGARVESFTHDLPFAPFRDLLSSMLGLGAEQDLAVALLQAERLRQHGLLEADLAVLRLLLGGNDRGVAPTREAMVAAAARLLLGMVQERPMILALDDADNLSPFARQLLTHVSRATAGAPILYLLSATTALPEEIGPLTRRIEVLPLPPAAQEALLAERCGAVRVEPELARKVSETAEGNPLYVTELARAMQRDGGLVLRGDLLALTHPERRLLLPLELESLITVRVDGLDAPLRAALQVAAIIGNGFSVELLAAAAELSDPESVITALVSHGLVVREQNRASFTSAMVWEAVRRLILDSQRRSLHQRVALAMEQLYRDQIDAHRADLALHYAEAGWRVQATEHALAVARNLAASQQLEQAATWCERGIGWASNTSAAEGDDARALEIQLRLLAGETWALVGQSSRAIRHLEVALDLAEDGGALGVQARALLALGRLYVAVGRLDRAAAHLETALALVGNDDTRDIAVEVLEALGLLELDRGDKVTARLRFEEALARAGDDDVLAARALLGLATAQLRDGHERQAMALLHRALQRADASGDRILAGRVLNNIGIAHYQARRYAEALERFRRALDIREGLGYRRGVVVNLHNIGDTWLRMGEPGKAWAAFDRSLEVAREVGWERGVVMNNAFLAFITGSQIATDDTTPEGGVSDAIVRLQAAAMDAERLHDNDTSINARWLLGRLLHQLGRREDAIAVLEEAAARARASNAGVLLRDVEDELRRVGVRVRAAG